MIIGFVLIVLWIFTYPSTPGIKKHPSRICGALVRSTCTDDYTSEWNSKNVGKSLKLWFDRIENIEKITPAEKVYHFISKILVLGKNSNLVKYIGNKNCENKKSHGPVWKLASPLPHMLDQFHDGFLYGTEAENGTMTGMYSFFRISLQSLIILYGA